MAELDFELPAAVPAGLCAYAFSRDVEPGELFAATGLSPELLEDPERPIRAGLMLPLWRFLLARFPNEPITLQMAEGMDFAFLGLAGQLIRHSPTVREAVARTLRFQRLYDPGLFTTFNEAEGRVTYGIGHVEEVRRLGAPLEMMAAISLNYLRQLVGERVPVIEVTLETQPRGDPEVYLRYFGGPVRFGQARTALVLDARVVDRPVAGADANVLRYLTAYADSRLERLPKDGRALPLVDQVRRALERALAGGDVGAEAIARALAMSSRTLQRRLSAEGTSLQSLTDLVRRDAAVRLLASQQTPIQEVAFMLGYQDVPSFYRAFKRWTGKTPAEVRAEEGGG